MAVPVPINSIVQFVQRTLLHNQVCLNTHHYRTLVNIEDWFDVDETLLLNFITAVDEEIALFQSNECADRRVSIQVIRPIPRLRATERAAISNVGKVAQSSLPSSCAAVVQRKGDFAMRNNFGRLFIPGIPVTFEANSRLTPDATSILDDVAESLLLDILGPTDEPWLEPVLFNDTLPTTALTRITYAQETSIIRQQRRREVGVGQ